MNLVCERCTGADFTRDRSRLELKGVYVNSNEMSSSLGGTESQPLAFELSSSLIDGIRGRAVSTREDAWPH
jgi:hypothetical protein